MLAILPVSIGVNTHSLLPGSWAILTAWDTG
jgi:hypothetical protein